MPSFKDIAIGERFVYKDAVYNRVLGPMAPDGIKRVGVAWRLDHKGIPRTRKTFTPDIKVMRAP